MDETVVCTITDTSDSSNGHYKAIHKGVTVYDVYSEDKTYTSGTQVYVLIPKDKNLRKSIQGRYIVEEAETAKWTTYKQKLVPMGQNVFAGGAAELVANGSKKHIELTNFDLTQLVGSSAHSTIYLKGDFRSLLANRLITQGNYGLLLVLSNKHKRLEVKLDSSDMFGNPYSFGGYFTQEKIANYNIEEDFTKAELYFYQDSNFKYKDDNTGIEYNLEASDSSDLFVSNIEILIGYNSENIEDNTVKIFTYDDVNYTTSNLEKDINLIWYNKDSNNQYLGFNDGVFNEKATNPDNFPAGVEVETNYYWIQWYVDNKKGTFEKVESGDFENYIVECQKTLTSTKVYASVWLNGSEYKSNILTFENSELKSDEINHLGITLKIEHDAHSQDLYSFYGSNNVLTDNSQQYKNRKVKFTWTAKDDANVLDDFWANATIRWYLPKYNTMLQPLREDDDSSSDTDSDYIFITRLGTVGVQQGENNTFEYRIKSVYQRNYTNNTIKCVIELPDGGGKVEASLTLAFSSSGNNGTSYTYVITPEGQFGFTNTSGQAVTFRSSLTDAEGSSISHDTMWYWYPKADVKQSNGTSFSGTTASAWAATYNVLRGTTSVTWAGKQVNLETFLPVTYSKNGEYYAQAPTDLVYDSYGKPIGIEDLAPLKLFKTADNSEVVDAEWSISYVDGNQTSQTSLSNPILTWLPTLVGNTIQPPAMYMDSGYYAILKAKIKISNTTTTVWTQPIIMRQWKHGSPLLNNWDGSMKIDAENNTILAAMLGAGVKNSDNTFSGVVIGDLAKVDSSGNKTNEVTGLIGYHHGGQSFGFKDDGTAFIGKSGTGRINFNGNKGTIESSTWIDKTKLEDGSRGVKIDLKDANLYLDKGNEYLHFDNNGLDIKVNNLSITGGLGGTNLLRWSKPIVPSYQWQSKWIISNKKQGSSISADASNSYYLLQLAEQDNQQFMCQTVTLKKGKKYTVSVKLKIPSGVKVVNNVVYKACVDISCVDEEKEWITEGITDHYKEVTISKDSWSELVLTFGTSSSRSSHVIKIKPNGDLKQLNISEIKLEEGAITTSWSPAPEDQTAYINGLTYLNQDNVFNKLTNGGTAKGIWKQGSELYINATYLGTGILCSNNWDGEWNTDDSGQYLKYIITNPGTKGAYFNLNEGVFEIKQENGNHFIFDGNGLDIKANRFCLETGSLGGPNLLKNTGPIEEQKWEPGLIKIPSDDTYIIEHWKKKDGTGYPVSGNDELAKYGNCIRVLSTGTSSNNLITQKIPLEGKQKYTLSGWVRRGSYTDADEDDRYPRRLRIRIDRAESGNSKYEEWLINIGASATVADWWTGWPGRTPDQTFEYKWQYFSITFDTTSWNLTTDRDTWLTIGSGRVKLVSSDRKRTYYENYISRSELPADMDWDQYNEDMATGKVTWIDDTVHKDPLSRVVEFKQLKLEVGETATAWQEESSASFKILKDDIQIWVGNTLTGYATTQWTTNQISSTVQNSISGLESKVNQTASDITNMVKKTDNSEAFGWSLTLDDFKIYRYYQGAKINILKIDAQSGNAEFSGSLRAVSGSFTSLTSGLINYNNENYYTQFSSSEIKLYTSYSVNNKPNIGLLQIGRPAGVDYWEDMSIVPIPILDSESEEGYGNLGTDVYKWDTIWSVNRLQTSKRNIKNQILKYDIDQAYEELKTMPIYTYYYNAGNSVKTQELKIGTMIDYIPVEVMATKNKDLVGAYDQDNLVFWNIAATQSIQNKLEETIARIENLENSLLAN